MFPLNSLYKFSSNTSFLSKLTSVSNHIKTCTTKCPTSFRYNYATELEAKMNEQIKNELFASNSYLALANHFARTDIGLFGSSGFFQMLSDDEREHALLLMQYQNRRGGVVEILCIEAPPDCNQYSLSDALTAAIELEVNNTNHLVALYEIAKEHNDECTMDFILTTFLHEEMEEIQKLGNIMSRCKTAKGGVGTYLVDLELQKKYPFKGKINISINTDSAKKD